MAAILVVEDHPLNRKLFRDLLSLEFAVHEAESAETARDVLQTLTPDLILMDIQLPGMDGLSLARRLKQDARLRHIPVVAVSAHAMQRDIERAREAGCVDYITKPITDDPYVLLDRLQRLIQEVRGA